MRERQHVRGKLSHWDGRSYDGMWWEDQMNGSGTNRFADGGCEKVEYVHGTRRPS